MTGRGHGGGVGWIGAVLAVAFVFVMSSCLSAIAEQAAPSDTAASSATPASLRLALVVGDGAYPARPLATSVNDAGLVAASLAQIGFDVTAASDVGRDGLAAVVAAFADKLAKADPNAVAMVYLAGYGLQYDGRNFFVPTDATIDEAGDIPRAAVAIDDLLKPLVAARVRARVVCLDLARGTPFGKDGAEHGERIADGLALTAAPPGTILGFNTSPGAVAPQDVAPYGTYARALAEAIQVPGLPVDDLLARLRLRVMERSNGAALPWIDGSLGDDVRLTPKAAAVSAATTVSPGQSVPAPVAPAAQSASEAFVAAVGRDAFVGYVDFLKTYGDDPLAPRIRTLLALRREALTWGDTLRANNQRTYWTYMRRYPRGPHMLDARRRLEDLRAPLDPPPRFDVVDFDGLPPPTGDELAIVESAKAPQLESPGDPIVPPVPDALLPPPNEAFYDALPMPLVSLRRTIPGVMPYAAPIAGVAEGPIKQLAVPDLQTVTSTLAHDAAGRIVLTTSSGDRVLLVASAAGDASKRTIVESTPTGAVVAKTDLARAGSRLAITQTGPDGAVLLRSISEPTSGGGRTIVLSDARGAVVSKLRVSSRDVILTAQAGEISPRAAQFAYLPPPPSAPAPAIVKTPAAVKQPAVKPAEPPVRLVALSTFAMPNPTPRLASPAESATAALAVPTTLPPLPPLDLPPPPAPPPAASKNPTKSSGQVPVAATRNEAKDHGKGAESPPKPPARPGEKSLGKTEAKRPPEAHARSATRGHASPKAVTKAPSRRAAKNRR